MTPITLHLSGLVDLDSDERALLDQAVTRKHLAVRAREDVIVEGDKPRYVYGVLDGWGCRYKLLPNGRRQIIAFFLPGDLCDANVFILSKMDHSIGAITPLKLAEISEEDFSYMVEKSPNISRALWCQELITASIQREWTMSVGQRTATQRVAHLLVEIFVRLRFQGIANGLSCPWLITQNDIADATGLTSIHVNRTLQELRAAGLIVLQSRMLEIRDLAGLKDMAMFDPTYLHFDRAERASDAILGLSQARLRPA